MNRKPSFLERLTGSSGAGEFDDETEAHELMEEDTVEEGGNPWGEIQEEPQQDGELPIDMYHTSESVVIRALVAGVSPSDLDVGITRDMVTIKGTREEDQEAPDEDYYHRELYWGSFSRTILLPEEVLIDEAEAKEKNGLLVITLPKVDKDRSTRLKVKTS